MDVGRIASLTSWLLSANCRVRPQMYRRESRVLYELIFVTLDWFRILMQNHLLILTHITLTLCCIHDSSVYSIIEAADKKNKK